MDKHEEKCEFMSFDTDNMIIDNNNVNISNSEQIGFGTRSIQQETANNNGSRSRSRSRNSNIRNVSAPPPPPQNNQYLFVQEPPMISHRNNSQQQQNLFPSLLCHAPPPLSPCSHNINIDLSYN